MVSSYYNEIHQVTDGLYISGALPLKDPKKIGDKSIKYILCCTPKEELGRIHENLLLSHPKTIIIYLPYKDSIDQKLWLKTDNINVLRSSDAGILISNRLIGLKNVPLMEIGYGLIDHALSNNKNVLVHCRAGVSRSASVIIMYLMRKYDMTYIEAESYLAFKRPVINPNTFFKFQLKGKEKSKKLIK